MAYPKSHGEKTYPNAFGYNQSSEENLPSMSPPPFCLDSTPMQMCFSSGAGSFFNSFANGLYGSPGGQGKAGEEKETAPIAQLGSANVEAAKKEMKELNIGEEAILQLQEKLTITKTGVYDTDTVHAVHRKQIDLNQGEKFTIKKNGIAGRSFFRWLGLVFTEVIEVGKIMPDFAKEFLDDEGTPKAEFQNGITVGTYTHYDDQKTNNKEFWQKANPWAKKNKALSLNDKGEVIIGKPIAITDVGDIIETTQSITRGLTSMWLFGTQRGWVKPDPRYGSNNPPPWTQIKNLGIFAHGMNNGIGAEASGEYKEGLLSNSEKFKKTSSNIESFAKGLDGAIQDDIRVLLFACNAGRGYGNKANYDDHRNLRGENEEVGEDGSFASMLQKELGEDSSVYGHFTKGHTTNNSASVVYGKDAGGQGSKHMFDLLYDSAYLDAQLEALFPDKSEAEREVLRPLLRKQMWYHYKDSIGDEGLRQAGRTQVQNGEDDAGNPTYRQLGKKTYADGIPNLGAEMFTNLEDSKNRLRTNFETKWMTNKKIKKIEKSLL